MFNITDVNIEISDTADLSSIPEMRLVDLYCKHMIRVDYDKESKANRLLSASRTIGYGYCEWGSHDYSRSNVFHHLGIIEKMEKKTGITMRLGWWYVIFIPSDSIEVV